MVLEYGWAYGEGGDKLKGKTLLCSVSAGGAEEAYSADGSNHFTLPELFRPLQQTAGLCGMDWLPPFALCGARAALDDGRLETHRGHWRRLLEGLRDGSLDPVAARPAALLNQMFEGEG